MEKLNKDIEELRNLKLSIHELRKLYDKIQNEDVKKELKNIIIVSDKIYKEIVINTQKTSKIKSFTNYYIQTVQKILNKYYEFNAKKILIEDTEKLLIRIEEFLPRVNNAFNKIYESLFTDEIADIDAEIKVMLKEIKF